MADDPGDALPEDLDVTALVGPYVFPDNARRRIQGWIYLGAAAVVGLLWVLRRDGGVLVNDGWAIVAGVLALLGAYCMLSAAPLKVRELDALAAAAHEVGFPVGHASAQMVWRGLRSVPTWRILVFSADEPPTRRGLVMVDGTDGTVLGSLVQDNPEVWDGVDEGDG
jgi:hypothetical protein